MTSQAAPIGGSMLGAKTSVTAGLALVGLAFAVWRFAVGLGPSTGLSDGYPWGLWIAFDVVTGTALACGGYAIALLVYIMNQGRYHPLVRPALLTSALGYSMAAIAIALDVGRPWWIWRIPVSVDKWNLDSALLEVALCVMAYVVVLWIELSPAFLEKWAQTEGHWLRGPSRTVQRSLEKILLWIIALGLLLPTMHQSSLGTVILLAGPRLHPLFNSAWVPLMFLLTCMAMGWAVVVLEATLSARAFGRKSEFAMLKTLSLPIGLVLAGFIGLRFFDIFWSGKTALLAESSPVVWMFWLEMLLFFWVTGLLLLRRTRLTPGRLFRAALIVVFAGALYRFDSYLVAFEPGPHWHYFPSPPEIMITVGLVALEIFIFIFIVNHFPIIAGIKDDGARAAQIGGRHG